MILRKVSNQNSVLICKKGTKFQYLVKLPYNSYSSDCLHYGQCKLPFNMFFKVDSLFVISCHCNLRCCFHAVTSKKKLKTDTSPLQRWLVVLSTSGACHQAPLLSDAAFIMPGECKNGTHIAQTCTHLHDCIDSFCLQQGNMLN